MSPRTRTTEPDLESHFGLRTLPFTREIAATERFTCEAFTEALRDLTTAVEQRQSACLVAAAGSGKTALLRALVDQLPEARYRTRYVKVTDLSKRDLCREIARATGVEPAGSYPVLVDRLQERMGGLDREDGLRSVLILDDAHFVRLDVLPLITILTNFEMDSRLVLSIVLAGHKGLTRLLERDDMAAARGRIAVKASLRSLSRDETHQYVEHRMALAGATTVPFDASAVDAIHETSRGNLRAIDHLARMSLDLAARRKIDTVDSGLVLAARKKIA